MDREQVRALIEAVQRGEAGVDDAVDRLSGLGMLDMGHTQLDTHRALRKGFPEVVYAEGKTPQQVAEIMARLSELSDQPILATRASRDAHEATAGLCGEVEYDELARCIVVNRSRQRRKANFDERYIAVVCAGTSDLPVAEEAALTAELLGNRVERVRDVGVAGLHRVMGNVDRLRHAACLVVVAGMEGALASVVGGLVDKPVVAVPTSVGYGAAFGGLAALLSMLNSCATGVAVMNIDNGFGAGYFASMVND
jgi:pyridinium-3,5-biscarboxylic acid mononucleotide synthase